MPLVIKRGPPARTPREDISQTLQEFLDLVWTHRKAVRACGWPSLISFLYYKVPRPAVSQRVNTREVLPFLKELEVLCRHPLAQPHLIQQSEPGLKVADAIRQLEAFQATDEPHKETLQAALDAQILFTHFGQTFYHLRCGKQPPAGSGRIYLNVTARDSIKVMTFVVTHLFAKCDDALRAKVAGPSIQRADRIVIWVTSLNRIENILWEIAQYQAKAQDQVTNRSFFNDGVARLCMQISGVRDPLGGRVQLPLRGVGSAADPENKAHQGFGESRINIISAVLKRVVQKNPSWATLRGEPAEAAKEVFVNEVRDALRLAGIDPKQVHL